MQPGCASTAAWRAAWPHSHVQPLSIATPVTIAAGGNAPAAVLAEWKKVFVNGKRGHLVII